MVSVKQQKRLLWSAVVVLVILLLGTLGVNLYYATSMRNIGSQPTSSDDDEQSDKICMRRKDYDAVIQAKSAPSSDIPKGSDRDRRVLNDPLYPALNRSETDTHNGIVEQISRKNLYNNTQEFTDRYRLVAYVTSQEENKDSGGNVWKLFARNKNKSQGEFYMIPANTNYDMKIMLTNEMVTGNDKLRDIYTIPKSLTLKSPLLNSTPYEVTELPMTDFTDSYN